MKFSTIIYDYDGTLSDPCGSITDTFNDVYFEYTGRTLPESQLIQYVGPPLVKVFEELLKGFSEDRIEEAVKLYRHKYNSENHKKSRLYPDVMAVLTYARENQLPQFIATAKKHETIELVCEYQKLNPFFVEINGLGKYPTKADIVCGTISKFNIDPDSCCLIGDRDSDINAAKAGGITSVGALWGFGSREELASAGADIILEKPIEMMKLLK